MKGGFIRGWGEMDEMKARTTSVIWG